MNINYTLKVFKERSSRDAFVLDPVKMAVSPDGKYVFIIGSRKVSWHKKKEKKKKEERERNKYKNCTIWNNATLFLIKI